MTPLHNPFAGETPFPQAGEGVVLKFTTSDILKLYGAYGPDPRAPKGVDPVTKQLTNHFWSTVINGAETHDPRLLFDMMRVGLKEPRDGKLVPIERPAEWWDDPPFPWSESGDVFVAGLTWSRWHLTPDQLAEQIRQQVAAMEREQLEGVAEVPQTGMTDSPTSSV